MSKPNKQPTLFISHGSPMIVIEPSAARTFLTKLGTTLERPRAILSISAHWATDTPTVSIDPKPGTMHDFG
ncbi:MAG: dioxygenase, partial [Magnetovibrio sp.]|nr:dioxygenase [Magnetovibrio sp.]